MRTIIYIAALILLIDEQSHANVVDFATTGDVPGSIPKDKTGDLTDDLMFVGASAIEASQENGAASETAIPATHLAREGIEIPEPSSCTLFALSGFGLFWCRRRRAVTAYFERE